VLAIRYDNARQAGDLVYSRGVLLDSGEDLETATLISLFTDARAQPSDVLPVGSPRRGYWADSLSDDSDTFGSRLWLLSDALATAENARLAEQYALEALRWLADEGHVHETITETSLTHDSISLSVSHTLIDGTRVTIDPIKVVG